MGLSARHADAFTELLNIGVGRAAAQLNRLVNSSIELNVPVVELVSAGNVAHCIGEPDKDDVTLVEITFFGPLEGHAILSFATDSAASVAALMADGDCDEETRAAAVTELGNILLNSVVGSIMNVLEAGIDYRVPRHYEGPRRNAPGVSDLGGHIGLSAGARFTVRENRVDGQVLLIFAVDAFSALISAIDRIDGRSLTEATWPT
ncbi:MAG: hypothetical protein OXU20_17770 [Myxococcales bacterium]|nr:hypothetical protein [Myxococcales bacterium]MDD9966040.1 hypothetical protein [Myxococcales bacterium]